MPLPEEKLKLHFAGPTLLSTAPLLNAVFYTTNNFNLRQQIENIQSTEGFLGDAAGSGTAVEDPLWGGTRAVGSMVGYIGPLSSDENKGQAPEGGDLQAHKRNEHSILQHAQAIQDNSVNVADLPHVASTFVGRSDRADVSAFAACGRSSSNSTICLDDITMDESLSKLDPNCPVMVCNLITNHQYKYIVNDISVAQALTDVHELTYVVKVQQPWRDWEKIYHRAEHAFEVLSEYYSLEPHR